MKIGSFQFLARMNKNGFQKVSRPCHRPIPNLLISQCQQIWYNDDIGFLRSPTTALPGLRRGSAWGYLEREITSETMHEEFHIRK